MSRRFITHRSPQVTLLPAVASLDDLRLLPAADTDDKAGVYVADEGCLYFFSRDSAAAEDLPLVVTPSAGAGRWLQSSGAGASAAVDVFPQTGKFTALGALAGTYSAPFPKPRRTSLPVDGGYRFGASGDYDTSKAFLVDLDTTFDTSQQLTFRIRGVFPLTPNVATTDFTGFGGLAIKGAGTTFVSAARGAAFSHGPPSSSMDLVSVGGWTDAATPGSSGGVFHSGIPHALPMRLRLSCDLSAENWTIEYSLDGDEWFTLVSKVASTLAGPYSISLFWYTSAGSGLLQVDYVVDDATLYPPTPVAWYAPDLLLFARSADFSVVDGRVAGWYDSSGNANHLAAATTGPVPGYPSSSLNDAVYADFAEADDELGPSLATLALTGDFAFIVVFCKTGAPAADEYLFSVGSTDVGEPGVGVYVNRVGSSADSWRFVIDGDAASFTMTDGVAHVLAVRREGTARTVYVDGVRVVDDVCPATAVTDTLFAGGREGGGRTFAGELAVLAAWETGLTESDALVLCSALADASLYNVGA